MKLITSVLLTLLFLAVGHAEKVQDYRLALNLSADAPKDCTSAGLMCESCTKLVSCVLNTDKSWTKTSIQSCASPQKCVNGACVNDVDPFCDGIAALDFPCQSEGVFPDPFYCNKFVMCVNTGTDKGLKPYVSTCPDGYGFNIANDLCDVKLTDGVCPTGKYPVPLCSKAGQSEALAKKPAEYYMCEEYSDAKKVLYPFLNVCEGGVAYSNYKCGKK
jgi:hypothetical protein